VSPPLSSWNIGSLTRERPDGRTTVHSPRRAVNNQVIISHTLRRTRTTRLRTRRGAVARTMHGSAAAVLPRARIHTHTTTNTIPTPVRRRRRRRLRRAILTFARRRQLARRTTVPHGRTGRRRSWILSIASPGLGGQCNLSSDSPSLSPLSALWGKVDRKQKMSSSSHTWNARVASLFIFLCTRIHC